MVTTFSDYAQLEQSETVSRFCARSDVEKILLVSKDTWAPLQEDLSQEVNSDEEDLLTLLKVRAQSRCLCLSSLMPRI
jgi:hypothetical protein